MKNRQASLEALKTIRAIRGRVLQKTADLSNKEAYRLAGFGEQAIEEILWEEEIPQKEQDVSADNA